MASSFFLSLELISFTGFFRREYSITLLSNPSSSRNHRALTCLYTRRNDCQVDRISDFDNRNVEFYGQFSPLMKHHYSLLSSSLKSSKEEEEKQNFYVNTGYAIRTLREELPELFYKELTWDIYRENIVFKDPLNTFTGIEKYKSILWALRFHGKIFFKALWVDIIRVWQPVESVIMVRWTAHGIPRVPWESHGRFDATSIYKLDKEGKIYEQRVDNIALNSPPKFHVLTVEELIQTIGCPPSTPKPTYFEVSSSPSIEVASLLAELNTASGYLADTYSIYGPERQKLQRERDVSFSS